MNLAAYAQRCVLAAALLTSGLLIGSCASCSERSMPERSASDESVRIPAEEADAPGRRLQRRVPLAQRDSGIELEHFFEALESVDNSTSGASVRVLQIGDSHTASDTTTGRLRELLQDRFGDGGRGFAHPGLPWSHFRQQQMSYGMDGSWDVFRILYGQSPGPWSVGGVRLHSTDGGATITRRTCDSCLGGRTFDRFSVHYLKQPGGGSIAVELDDERVATIDTSSQFEEFAVFTMQTTDAPHELRLRLRSSAPVDIFGISTARSDGGIVYDALGINGAQVQHYLRADPDFTREAVADIDPDLIVVALGPNEAFDNAYRVADPENQVIELLGKLETYRDQYRRLLQRLKAGAPAASCLVLLPPDLKERNSGMPCSEWRFGSGPIDTPLCITPPPYNYGGIINAQRHAAALEGCATYEQQTAMGGEGSFVIWQQLGLGQWDGIHFTAAGYDLLADNLYGDIMSAYERWLAGEPAELLTNIIFPGLTTTARPTRDAGESRTQAD